MLTTEKLNRLLYSSRDTVDSILRFITVLNSLAALGLLTYGYGFNLTTEKVSAVIGWLDLVFAVFVLVYLTRVFYAFQRRYFVESTRLEAVLMAILITNGISNYLFNYKIVYALSNLLQIKSYTAFYEVVSTAYVVVLIILESGKAGANIASVNIKPAISFMVSFVALIGIGAGLLTLPAMTVIPGSMPFLDAVFTATSAVCVTGLIVVDTATYFTFKGQLVIMLLIQLGGLGILSFATFFASFLRQAGIKHQYIIQGFISSETLSSAVGLLRQIVFLTLLIEAMGAVAIFMTWGPDVPFDSMSDKIFFSVFHSIAAFCNAGFSLYTNNLYEIPVRNAYVLHVVVALLVILGGLGFSTITDVFSPTLLRERLAKPWKDWKLNSKVNIYMAVTLIVFGSVGYYLLERRNTLANLNLLESIIASFFQSVNTRTAGFNSVDFTQIQPPALILMIFLMFVGASPGSTGGGIKTTTFLIIAVSVISTIQGKKVISLERRTIPSDLLFKAFSVITFAAAYNLIAVFVLSISEPGMDIIRLMFEQVSAFATVGLSTGITSSLSPVGKIVIILSMYIGRIGTLTLALALSRQVISNAYKYPDAYIMVG